MPEPKSRSVPSHRPHQPPHRIPDDFAGGDPTLVQPVRFAEGSSRNRQVPPPQRRVVPEPRATRPAPPPAPASRSVLPATPAQVTFSIPLPAPAPTKVDAPRPATADIIPITRARTTPPKSFDALVEHPAERQASPTVIEPVMPAVKGKAQWATFIQLGLGPPAETPGTAQSKAAKYVVSTYRALGFAILSIIVLVLVGYIFTSAFYFVSDSWIEPMVVSRSDERVVAMQAQVAEQQNTRDRIAADLNAADREIIVQQAFQAEFAAAIRADLDGRNAELDRVRDLAGQYRTARARIQRSNSAYASASKRKMQQEYAAGLIDRGDMLAGKYQVAQITTSSLGLADREAEYQNRAADLEAEAASLEAILGEQGGDAALSYDVLQIKQQYEMSRLESAKAIENREALAAALERQDEILEGLRSSPYLRAVEDGASVAFVPYSNLKNVKVGAPLYACKLEMLFCSRVGKVMEILDGEVVYKHPHRDKMMRGQMVELELDHESDAREDVLFVGGRPLLL